MGNVYRKNRQKGYGKVMKIEQSTIAKSNLQELNNATLIIINKSGGLPVLYDSRPWIFDFLEILPRQGYDK